MDRKQLSELELSFDEIKADGDRVRVVLSLLPVCFSLWVVRFVPRLPSLPLRVSSPSSALSRMALSLNSCLPACHVQIAVTAENAQEYVRQAPVRLLTSAPCHC
jgi:hypothetical protein